MKRLFWLIVGFAVGYQMGKMAASGGEGAATAQRLADAGKRVAGFATTKGYDAVVRARGTIQSRMGGGDGYSMN